MCFVMSIFFNFRKGRKWKRKGVRERLKNYRNRKSMIYPFPNTLEQAVESLEDITPEEPKSWGKRRLPRVIEVDPQTGWATGQRSH